MVECTGLENRRGFTPSVSSNLTASATSHIHGLVQAAVSRALKQP